MSPTDEDIAWFKSTFHPIPKARLPDDCVEYSLYLFASDLDLGNDPKCRARLLDVQKQASLLQKKWLKDYIWQRQSFSLETVKENGLTFLRGRTEYGDSVEDEWVVVWLLRDLTKNFDDLWVKIGDNDGEFLLIEAAGSLPTWLESEVAENRVWIHRGGLHIIKPKHEAKDSKSREPLEFSLHDARECVLKEPKRLMHSQMIEEEAFHRLRNYPDQIVKNMHHALVTLPRQIAFLLKQKPSYISPTVEAFYIRDPIALKPLQTNDSRSLLFNIEDLVNVSVKMPKVMYAQLRSQEFPPPPAWKSRVANINDREKTLQIESGMKISCGFEMLVVDTQNQDKPAVREIKMLLEDLQTGDEQLPTDEEIDQWAKQQDDESWLNISLEDLEGELAGKAGKASGKPADFGDRMAQENLQRIVAQFENLMSQDEAGPDEKGLFDDDSENAGGNSSSDDGNNGEDVDASFDEDQFTSMMREMMGMPTDADIDNTAIRNMVPGVVEELDSDGEEEAADDVHTLMSRMGAELDDLGALGPNRSSSESNQPTRTTGQKGKERADDFGDKDINVDAARNILLSFWNENGPADQIRK